MFSHTKVSQGRQYFFLSCMYHFALCAGSRGGFHQSVWHHTCSIWAKTYDAQVRMDGLVGIRRNLPHGLRGWRSDHEYILHGHRIWLTGLYIANANNATRINYINMARHWENEAQFSYHFEEIKWLLLLVALVWNHPFHQFHGVIFNVSLW